MKRKPALKLLNVILCDDVRREASGKDILIGVYTGDVLVQSFPVQITLQLWMCVEFADTEEFDLDFRILDDEGNEAIRISGKARGESASELGTLPIPKIGVQIAKAGRLKFQWKIGGGKWQNILEKSVRLIAQVPAPAPAKA